MADILVEENANEEEQDKEFQTVMDYEKKFRAVKVPLDKVLFTEIVDKHTGSIVASEHSHFSNSGMRRNQVQLPKIQLKKFSGDVKDWLGFWAQFQKIHEDEDIAVADKFQYLVHSMVQGSRTQEVVGSYPQSTENYSNAIKALKQRLGG